MRHDKRELVVGNWKLVGPRLKSTEPGFTIVELMIATVVFSMTLMIVATGFVQIGRMFYKGITQAKTQEVARNVLDEVSRNIQFSVGDVRCVDNTSNPCDTADMSGTLCIGGTHYIFNLNQVVTSTTPALRRAVTSSSAACGTLTTGEERLAQNMRLVDFTVNCLPNPDICDISMVVAHGDTDLLNVDMTNRTAKCFGSRSGTQFCAVTNLKTSVLRRVN